MTDDRPSYLDLQCRNEELERRNKALEEYVAEAAGPESALLPISMLHELVPRFSHVPREQLSRAVMNVAQLDLLRRCHEDRSDLKQQLRDLQGRHEVLRTAAETMLDMRDRSVPMDEKNARWRDLREAVGQARK